MWKLSKPLYKCIITDACRRMVSQELRTKVHGLRGITFDRPGPNEEEGRRFRIGALRECSSRPLCSTFSRRQLNFIKLDYNLRRLH